MRSRNRGFEVAHKGPRWVIGARAVALGFAAIVCVGSRTQGCLRQAVGWLKLCGLVSTRLGCADWSQLGWGVKPMVVAKHRLCACVCVRVCACVRVSVMSVMSVARPMRPAER